MTPTTRIRTLPRPRLPEMIDQAGPGVVTVLRAPAGYGKTVALAEWLEEADPARRITVSLAVYGGGSAFQAVAAALELGEVGAADAPSALENWVQNLQGPTKLVLDDASAGGAPGLLEVATDMAALAKMSPHLQIVVAGRPGGVGQWGVSSAALFHLLTEADLRFSDEELLELAELRGVDGAARDAAGAAFGDWPGGIAAVFAGARAGEANFGLDRVAATLYEVERDALAQELFTLAAQVPALRPEPLAQALATDKERVRGGLAALTSEGILFRGRDESGETYTLWPGLRPYVMNTALPSTTGRKNLELRRLHALAVEKADPGGALQQLLSLKRFDDATNLAQRNLDRLLADEDRTLATLRTVALRQLEPYPTLLLCRLILERPHQTIPIDTVEALAATLRAALTEGRSTASDYVYGALGAMQIAAERMLGLWDSALSLSRELHQFLDGPAFAQDEQKALQSPIPHAVISLAGLLGGDLELAQRAARSGLKVAELHDNRLEKVHALSLESLALILMGDAVASRDRLDAADKLAAEGPLDTPEYSWADGELARTFLALHEERVAEAEEALGRLVPEMDRMEQWPMVVFAETMVARRVSGEYAALTQLRLRLEKIPAARELAPYWKTALVARLVDLTTWAGRYQEAEAILRRSERQLGGVTGGAGDYSLQWARLALFRGDYENAAHLAARVGSPSLSNRLRAHAVAVGALAAFNLGHLDKAKQQLAEYENLTDEGRGIYYDGALPHGRLLEGADALGPTELAQRVRNLPSPYRTYQYLGLTATEQIVLEALTEEHSLPQTADELYISTNTLKSHLRNIYAKLHVSSRKEVLTKAWRLGLLS